MESVDHLIVGGDSRIGQALYRHFVSRDASVAVTTRRSEALPEGQVHLDLMHPDKAELPRAKAVYLVAAMARLRQCREDPALARLINVASSEALACRFTGEGASVVFLSTEKVFDGARPGYGTEDAVCPATMYGRTKAEAERAVLACGPRVSVLRLSKVVEPSDELFNSWMAALRSGQKIKAFGDLYAAPVSATHVVKAMEGVAALAEGGLWQLSGSRDVNYVEIGRFLARRCGASESLVEPALAAEAGMPVEERPRHTVMDMSRVADRLGIVPGDPFREIERGLGLAAVPESTPS